MKKHDEIKWHSLSDFLKLMKDTMFSEEEISRANIIKAFTFLAKMKAADHRMTDSDEWRRNIETLRIFHALDHDKNSIPEQKILHNGLMCRYTRVLPSSLERAGIQALIEFGPEWLKTGQYHFLSDELGYSNEFDAIQEIRLQQKELA